MSRLIGNLFKESKNSDHELEIYPDLSDEKVFKTKLPENYDIYWFHISAIEDEAIREIKIKQPWSKLIARTNSGIENNPRSLTYYSYILLRQDVDQVVPKICDQGKIIETFALLGVNLSNRQSGFVFFS